MGIYRSAFAAASAAAHDLRGQVVALVQLGHRTADPRDVELARAILFRAAGDVAEWSMRGSVAVRTVSAHARRGGVAS